MYSTEENEKPKLNDNNPTTMDNSSMLKALGMEENDPPSIDIDYSAYDDKDYFYDFTKNLEWGNVNGIKVEQLNAAYEKAKLYNGWMFIKFTKSEFKNFSFSADDTQKFNKKMVLVIQAGADGTNLFKSGAGSNCLILVEDDVKIQQFGNNDMFRGLIVKRGREEFVMRAAGWEATNSMNIEGAVYCVKDKNGNAGKFKLEGGTKRITIKYDPNVLQQIADELPGLVVVGNSEPQPVLKRNSDPISAKQQSRWF